MASTAGAPPPIKDDYLAKLAKRKALKEKNIKYWEDDALKAKPPLDSSLKKHTTLLNRLRSALLTTSAEAFLKELDGLTLTKYTEEIRTAVLEGISGTAAKGKADVEGAVEVVTHLHARLAPDFYPSFLPELISITNEAQNAAPTTSGAGNDKDREKEEKDRISRMRPVLRMIAELSLVGAWEGYEGGKAMKGVQPEDIGPTYVLDRLTYLMSNDPQYNNIPLLVTFLKSYKRAYLGLDEQGDTAAAAKEDSAEEELVPAAFREKFRKAFEDYFKTAGKALVKGQTKLLEQDKRNQEAYIKAGEIFEDRQHAYERMVKAVEKLQNGVQSLADLLNMKVPEAPTALGISKTSLQIVDSGPAFGKDGEDHLAGGIWDDDEERKFYEDILDLAHEVPPSILGLKQNGEVEQVEPEILSPPTKTLSIHELDEDVAMDAENGTKEDMDDDAGEKPPVVEDDADPLQSGPAARLAAIFAALPEANNRTIIDKLAADFAYLNSKPARKRCYKFLGSVPKTRTDLLPHYARFAATLNKYMPDIGVGLVAILDEEFKYLQRKKLVKELESVRIKNIRFYGELAKFKVAQPHTILHVLQVCVSDLTGPNVDNVANLLESCGRFLLRSEDTKEKAKTLVEIMRRKQSAQHFDTRQQLVLENAYYQCNPPERVQREQVQLTPVEAFIEHLLHDVLMKKTVDKVLKLLRKLHWEDEEVYGNILRAFTEIWELKYGNIPMVAMLVYDLQKYHLEFSLAVVDQVLEDVRAGMEDNIFKYNQRRISTIKYLGELYMYRVVNTPVIFDVLWSLISFGHVEGLPIPGRSSPIDSADDFFRIRLVCALLDTCGGCFDKGSSKKKLDQFLVIFQLYCLCKQEMPMDVEFMLSDTLETIRPKMVPFKNFLEAAEATDELLATMSQDVLPDDDDDEEESDGESEGEHRGDDDKEEDEDIDGAENVHETRIDDDDDDENVVLIKDVKEEEYDQEEEDAFNREFAKMLADTTDARKVDRKTAPPVFDTAVPLIRRQQQQQAQQDAISTEAKANHMQFSLLSKKGNKQQIRSLDIPVDSAIAVNSLSQQEKTRQEQEQMKRLVLQNERRQEASEKAAWEQNMRSRGIRVKYTDG